MKRLILPLCIVLGSLVVAAAFDARYQIAHADGSAAAMAGSGSDAPSAGIADPVASPSQAFDELKAAKKAGWSVLAFTLVLMLGRALGSAQKLPLIGTKLAWLGRGKWAVGVAALVAVGAACYDALANGGSWLSIGSAAVVALAHTIDAGGAA